MDTKRVYAEINLDNLLWNLSIIKKKLPKDSKIYAVLKADAYGNGAVHIGMELENIPYIFGYACATFDEAMELREYHLKKNILILGYIFPNEIEKAINNDISMTVYNIDCAKEISKLARKNNKIAKIHIAINTGMNRIGYNVNRDSVLEIKEIYKLSNIVIEGVFTHFSKADEKDKTFTKTQQTLFNEMKDNLIKEGIKCEYYHTANSAAILEFSESYSSLVRLGISMYGMWPSDKVKRDIPLKPILSLYSSIINIHTVNKGSLVGYGGIYKAKKDILVATISIGYADGVPRSISNKGYVLIHGKKAPIIGRICMDQMMVDITDIKGVKIEDKVTIIGTENDNTITMEDISSITNRLNYEISCALSNRRVKRIYIKNNSIIN